MDYRIASVDLDGCSLVGEFGDRPFLLAFYHYLGSITGCAVGRKLQISRENQQFAIAKTVYSGHLPVF
ncbi:MAG: hypothetical protein HC832_04990 [Leptolyngbyaceae cyanobacterium RM1_405_57]|nr:hypothetical protein [Leptolyngbyaceae cyanobacterium RM1_405_57]